MAATGHVRSLLALGFGVALALLFVPLAASAQDADAVLGRQVWQSLANCRECHGWAANGQQELPQQPQGANLRETSLTPADMAEVIRCGRPATEMPYFGGNATWGPNGKCYGMTRAEAGPMMPIKADSSLSDRQISSVVAYIFASLVGKGPITREECDAFFGAGQAKCAGYAAAGK